MSALSPHAARFPELPILGEKHPLNVSFRRVLIWSAVWTSVIHIGALATWLIIKSMKHEEEGGRNVKIVQYVDMGVPPSLSQNEAAPVNLATQVAPPSIGVPEPVPDFQAPTTTIASTEEMNAALDPMTIGDGGSGDSIVVNLEGDRDPSPDDFVAYEEPPALINMPSPVYPDLARTAEVEAVVQVQVQVGKDGKVSEAIVKAGHPMLNDAAIAAVKQSTWRPALQQHKPVAVWVIVPIRFSLN